MINFLLHIRGMELSSRIASLWIFLLCLVLSTLVAFSLPPIPQWESYHFFAASGSVLGIAHFQMVISNIPITIVGIWGLVFVLMRRRQFDNRLEFNLWGLFFLFIVLTSAGSAAYHWNANNETLFWDRLPLILAVTALFSALFAEQVGKPIATWTSILLLLVAAWSVLIWWIGEQLDQGDLRLYGLMQSFPIVGIPLISVLFPRRYPGWHLIYWAIGWFLLAKVFEYFDLSLYDLTQEVLSGHALKHLAAAVAIFFCLRYLAYRNRRVMP